MALEHDPIGQPKALCQSFQAASVLTVAVQVQSPISLRPRRGRQHFEEDILAFARRVQSADAGKTESPVSFERPAWRCAEVDIEGIANHLCISELAANLLFRQPAICLRNKVAPYRRSKGRSVALGQSVSGPPKIVIALHYRDERQPFGGAHLE
jgi:hypothetical protein